MVVVNDKRKLGVNKKSFVSCNMPNKVRVGRSAFFFFFLFCQKGFCGQNRRKIRFAKQMVKNCENSVFRGHFLGTVGLQETNIFSF